MFLENLNALNVEYMHVDSHIVAKINEVGSKWLLNLKGENVVASWLSDDCQQDNENIDLLKDWFHNELNQEKTNTK